MTGDVTGTATNYKHYTRMNHQTQHVTCCLSPTGNLPAKTGTNLTFNSNTGDLAATSATLDHTFVGSDS